MKRTAKQDVYQLQRLVKYDGGYSSSIMDKLRIAYLNNKDIINLREEYLSMIVNRCNNSDKPLFLLYRDDVPLVFISISYHQKTILSLLPIKKSTKYASKKNMFLALWMLVIKSRTLSNNDVLSFRINREIKNKRLRLADYLGGSDYIYKTNVADINKIGTNLFGKLLA